VLQQSMLAQGAVGPAIRNSAIALALQGGLVVALSLALGVPGAALGVLLSSAVAVAMDLGYVNKRLAALALGRFAFAPIAASALVACALYVANGTALWMRAAVALGGWAVAVAAFRILPREELRFMRQLARLPGRKRTPPP
jgi:peptidoglycan biosynthesis protein MviN/MurJ (putative lipid II flippase)